jgi:hypothetical protein
LRVMQHQWNDIKFYLFAQATNNAFLIRTAAHFTIAI